MLEYRDYKNCEVTNHSQTIMPPEAKGKFALPFGSESITFIIKVLITVEIVEKDCEKDCDQERQSTTSPMKSP